MFQLNIAYCNFLILYFGMYIKVQDIAYKQHQQNAKNDSFTTVVYWGDTKSLRNQQVVLCVRNIALGSKPLSWNSSYTETHTHTHKHTLNRMTALSNECHLAKPL